MLLHNLAAFLPKTLYGIHSYFKRQTDFIEYAVCPQCYHLYNVSECITRNVSGVEESRVCDHVEFPHHPQQSRRKKCGAALMKQVKLNGKYKLVPRKVYLYRSVIHSLTDMIRRPGFYLMCTMDKCGVIYIQ